MSQELDDLTRRVRNLEVRANANEKIQDGHDGAINRTSGVLARHTDLLEEINERGKRHDVMLLAIMKHLGIDTDNIS